MFPNISDDAFRKPDWIMMFRFLSRAALSCLSLFLLLASANGMACSGRLHIEVKDSGVYVLDYGAIVAMQPGLKDCPSSDLLLLNHDQEVPLRVLDDDKGRFGPGSRIEWVGQALHGPQSWYDPYSTVNVYQLGAMVGAHARMREFPAAAKVKPALLRRRLHFEQENLMLRLGVREMKPGEEPDVWQWAKLTPIDPQPFAFAFDLPDADLRASTNATTLTLDFRGVSNVIAAKNVVKPVDHVVEVSLNGEPLQTIEWDGRSEMRKELSVPRALLKAKANAISLRVLRRDLPTNPKNFIVDVVMFNWLEVSYPIRGDLGAGTVGFTASADAPIGLEYHGTGTPELYAADGTYRQMTPLGNGHYSAGGAGNNVDLYPVVGGHMLSPALLRAVADRDLRAADPGYDYLIVAHPRLLDAIQPLALYHREHGHQVVVVDVDDLYDQFNAGIAHPVAIRDLVAWGTQHWKIKPRYLLLVGDASTDIHHDVRNGRLNGSSYLMTPQPPPDEVLPGNGFGGMLTYAYPESDPQLPNRNLIPTWQFPTSEGQSASDNDFVTLKVGDFHPTLAVGRFPVVEPAEVKAIVDKTLAYLSKPAPGPWRRKVTFVSTSEVVSFKQASDKIAADLDRQGFATNSVYTNFNDKDVARYQQARTTLRNDLDAGSLLVHFLGHGGSYIWRVGPMGDLFSLDDVSKLTNAGRYPMVLAMTCFSAPFDNPSDDSIGERFLREADKGAVAVFASSWKDSPNPEYSKSLIEELLKPGNPIGDAIVTAKAKIADRSFVEMYNLLGDPALVLARPQGKLQFMRTLDRWNPQILVRIPESDFGGDVYVDWIDASGKVLASRNYQARDRQFALMPVDKAAVVSVYVADTRNGNTAAGGMSLQEPPKPAIPAASGKAVAGPHAPAAPATPAKASPAPAKLPPNPHDTIARLGFDAAAVKSSQPRVDAAKRAATGAH
jgi:hypothetical protein